jgi:Domain of unknown function (DUF4158)
VVASIDRTAYPRFKRVVWSRELAESFTSEAGEIEWARGKTTTEQHFLALAVRLKCYQRLGYFPKLDEVPEVVVGHVRGKLGLPEGTAAEVDADRTAKRPGSSSASASEWCMSRTRSAGSLGRRSGKRRRPRTTRPT